jgi:methyl-accepting chemotaxis protein
VEINMETALEITELIAKSEQWLNSADQKHIENTKLVAQIDRQKHRIAEMADEITRLNAAMEEATALAAQNVVDC